MHVIVHDDFKLCMLMHIMHIMVACSGAPSVSTDLPAWPSPLHVVLQAMPASACYARCLLPAVPPPKIVCTVQSPAAPVELCPAPVFHEVECIRSITTCTHALICACRRVQDRIAAKQRGAIPYNGITLM